MELRLLMMVGIYTCIPAVASQTSELEARVSALEQIIRDLEPTMEQRYGLVRHCFIPEAVNGFAQCDEEKRLKPGTKCRVTCNSGYIETPGKDLTTCEEGGVWSVQLQCEVPLVVVGGGQINDTLGSLDIEVIDFQENSSCVVKLPAMKKRDNSYRTLFNLIYIPDDKELLACNGLTEKDRATCDSLKIRSSASSYWEHHSYPNKGSIQDANWEMAQQWKSRNSYGGYRSSAKRNPNEDRGRYAAEAVTIDNRPNILGGMIYEKDKHWVTSEARHYDVINWTGRLGCPNGMRRAFFCAVKIQEEGAVQIGGFTDNGITDSVEISKHCRGRSYKNITIPSSVASLPTPLSGHACTALPNSYDILVNGGSRDENDESIQDSYVYRWSENKWESTGSMNAPRFGHRTVAVGPKVYTIGGKERNPEKHLDTIEEFHIGSGEWTLSSKRLKRTRAHFGIALVPRSIFPTCA